MVKIGYLRGALNTEMQRAMIGPVTYTDYGGFVQALLVVGSQLDCLQYQKGRTAPITNQAACGLMKTRWIGPLRFKR